MVSSEDVRVIKDSEKPKKKERERERRNSNKVSLFFYSSFDIALNYAHFHHGAIFLSTAALFNYKYCSQETSKTLGQIVRFTSGCIVIAVSCCILCHVAKEGI